MGVCFVCQNKLLGERTRVCSSVTPKGQVPFPEMIAEFLGEEFVVIVNPTDHLCKKCTDLILFFDKTTSDVKNIKDTMKGLIGKKYGPFPSEQPVVKVETENMNDMAQRNIPGGSRTTRNFKKPCMKSSPTKVARNFQLPSKDNSKKIFKCGFCPFQSKELESVRSHMRIHLKDGETRPTVTGPPPALSTPPTLKKTMLYKCQVCLTSFESKNDCLHHLHKDHNQTVLSSIVKESTNVLKPVETPISNGQQQQNMSPKKVNGHQQLVISPRKVNGNQRLVISPRKSGPQQVMSPMKVNVQQQAPMNKMMSPMKVNIQQNAMNKMMSPMKVINGQQQQVPMNNMSPMKVTHFQQQVPMNNMSPMKVPHFQQQVPMNNVSPMKVTHFQQQVAMNNMSPTKVTHFQQQQVPTSNMPSVNVINGEQSNIMLGTSMMFNHSIPAEESKTGGEQAQAVPATSHDMLEQVGSIQFVDDQGKPVSISIKSEVAGNENNVEDIDLEAMLAALHNETTDMGYEQNLM